MTCQLDRVCDDPCHAGRELRYVEGVSYCTRAVVEADILHLSPCPCFRYDASTYGLHETAHLMASAGIPSLPHCCCPSYQRKSLVRTSSVILPLVIFSILSKQYNSLPSASILTCTNTAQDDASLIPPHCSAAVSTKANCQRRQCRHLAQAASASRFNCSRVTV